MAGTVINKPTLGSATLPFPSEAKIEPIWISAEHTTVDGTTRRDVMGRKYKYTLSWDYINVTDYNNMEAEVNALSAKTFTYAKWPQSASGISVLAELSSRELVYGTGSTAYLSSVTLTLTEVSSRI